MRHALAAIMLLATPAAAQTAAATRPIASLDATLSGQPIVAPTGRLRVTVSETTLPPGGVLPPHRHPYARIVQVAAGRLRVTNLDSGQIVEVKAGDWLVDSIEQWHEAVALGNEPVRLLVIDQAPPGATVTVPRPQ